MKGEIKYRGKCADTWRKGDHLTYQNGDVIKAWGGSMSFEYTVDPETVGRYLNVYDVNGNEIYEGDIIKTPDGILREIFWNEYALRWDMTTGINGDKPYDFFCRDLLAESEVVGNIHDTPELLNYD